MILNKVFYITTAESFSIYMNGPNGTMLTAVYLSVLFTTTSLLLCYVIMAKPFRDPADPDFIGLTQGDKLMALTLVCQLAAFVLASVCITLREGSSDGTLDETTELVIALIGLSLIVRFSHVFLTLLSFILESTSFSL